MTPLILVFAGVFQTAPAEPVRAELCLAHVNVMIAEAVRETGRVAGPSWFIRDWWEERTPASGEAGTLTPEQRAALERTLAERKTQDRARHDSELGSCVDEAIGAGAVPGMARVSPG